MNIAVSNNKFYIYDKAKLERIKEFDNNLDSAIKNISKKEKLLKAKSMIMIDGKDNTVVATFPIIRAQHYYPLSILDFA